MTDEIKLLSDDEGRRRSPAKSPCPTCGKMITTAGYGRLQHMKVHQRPSVPDQKTRERFERKFTVLQNGCWQWNKTTPKCPYGSFHFAGRNYMAFIFSWWLYRGEIVKTPPVELDHLCKNKACVNPEHLEPVTRRVNMLRASKPTCPKGHAFTPENTYIRKDGSRRAQKRTNGEGP